MDPLTMATTFATIVGLISNFKSERTSHSQGKFQDFLQWLIENNHKEIILVLETNKNLSLSLENTLNNKFDKLDEQIGKFDEYIGIISQKLDCFSEIASSINIYKTLSDQSISILKQLVESDAPKFIEIHGDAYILMDGPRGGEIEFHDFRFIEDDLRTLVERGLLRLEIGSKGTRIFYVTRAAQSLVK